MYILTYFPAYKAKHSCETLCSVSKTTFRAPWTTERLASFFSWIYPVHSTLDHGVLLDRLREELDIGGTVLDWLTSYLVNRYQVVTICGEKSKSCLLGYGVPQGSVLGPQLFTVYSMLLSRILREHGLKYHFFADDSQLFAFVEPVRAPVGGCAGRLELWCSDIRAWMGRNFLRLDDDKTEVLLISSSRNLRKISMPGERVDHAMIAPSATVRDLGAILTPTRPWSLMSVLCVCQSAITLGTLARLGGSSTGTLARSWSTPL